MTSTAKMNEALRLTKCGKLTEALAILRGDSCRTEEAGASRDSRSVIDMAPPALRGGAWSARSLGDRGSFVSKDGAAYSSETSPGGTRPGAESRLKASPDGVVAGLRGLGTKKMKAPVPKGARFEQRSFSNAAGTREYKIYIPSRFSEQRLPLIVMLHGCTQSADDFAVGTRMNELAERTDFLVVYPVQSRAANASKCWNWFNAGDQKRDQGEPSLIAGITREVIREFSADPRRIYVAGLSAGGAAAAIMGSAYPDLYAAVGVHSGLACGAARDMPSAFEAMRNGPGRSEDEGARHSVPTIVFHGDVDRTVHPVNGDKVIALCDRPNLTRSTTTGESPGGMSFTRMVETDSTGRPFIEQWTLHGAGHAWSGGSPSGSYTDPAGPDASKEMVRFFLQQTNSADAR